MLGSMLNLVIDMIDDHLEEDRIFSQNYRNALDNLKNAIREVLKFW